MELLTDSLEGSAKADDSLPVKEGFIIAPDDLDELEALYESLLLANQQEKPRGLFRLATRLKHISVRTRGLLEDL